MEKMHDKETTLLDIKTKFFTYWYKNFSNIKNVKKSHKDMEEILDNSVINKSSIRDIFKYYQKMINTGGENMRRKVLRLYSIKKQLKK
jgi:hypothetical protein